MCSRWNRVSKSPQFWKALHLARWEEGDWAIRDGGVRGVWPLEQGFQESPVLVGSTSGSLGGGRLGHQVGRVSFYFRIDTCKS